MKTLAYRRIAALAFLFISAQSESAWAEFSICNRSVDVVNVAIGKEDAGDFITEGWWTIGANRCSYVIREPLNTRFIYVYAMDVFGHTLLEGTARMCVGDNKFKISGEGQCWERGFKEAKFHEVDTQAVERWTLFLSSPSN